MEMDILLMSNLILFMKILQALTVIKAIIFVILDVKSVPQQIGVRPVKKVLIKRRMITPGAFKEM